MIDRPAILRPNSLEDGRVVPGQYASLDPSMPSGIADLQSRWRLAIATLAVRFAKAAGVLAEMPTARVALVTLGTLHDPPIHVAWSAAHAQDVASAVAATGAR